MSDTTHTPSHSPREAYTHFGYEEIPVSEKDARVQGVFTSVASKYDLMNNLMSFGLHHAWKRFMLGRGRIRAGMKVLDLAGGTGDLTRLLIPQVGERGQVVLADLNRSMLEHGRTRLEDQGLLPTVLQCDALSLPFPDRQFDVIMLAFGLRNMCNLLSALQEMYRVLRPGGRLLVLEFSRPAPPLRPLYDQISFRFLPWLGERIVGDANSYRYLAESIRVHPDQAQMTQLMYEASFDQVQHFNLCAGVVALHEGVRY